MNDKGSSSSLSAEDAEDLYQNAPCGYLSVAPDGTIVSLNETLLSWLAFERFEIQNQKKFQHLLAPGDRIFFETHIAPLIEMQGYVNEVNLSLVRKDRSRIPVLLSTKAKLGENGKAVQTRMTLFDITDRKRFETQLRHETLRAENALRAKVDFVSMLSHEIRTPMNAVIGATNLLDETKLTPEQKQYVTMLQTSSENLMELLNSILDLTKIESGKSQLENRSFSFKKLTEDVTHGQQGRAREKGIVLKRELDPAIPNSLVGDPVKIGQILTNLIGNAIKFTSEGSVSLNVVAKSIREEIVTLNFEVADTGIGIPPDRVEMIFEEYSQADYETSKLYGGTGLGLTISKRLAAMYNTKIQVTSVLGEGSKFSFDIELGISRTQIPSLELRPSRLSEYNLDQIKILVADDSIDNLFLTGRLLNKWNAVVVTAKNGSEAVSAVNAQDFHLILMDLHMPVMSGYDATAAIRALADPLKNGIPILAFSASNKIGQPERANELAFAGIVPKPYQPDILYQAILKALSIVSI